MEAAEPNASRAAEAERRCGGGEGAAGGRCGRREKLPWRQSVRGGAQLLPAILPAARRGSFLLHYHGRTLHTPSLLPILLLVTTPRCLTPHLAPLLLHVMTLTRDLSSYSIVTLTLLFTSIYLRILFKHLFIFWWVVEFNICRVVLLPMYEYT